MKRIFIGVLFLLMMSLISGCAQKVPDTNRKSSEVSIASETESSESDKTNVQQASSQSNINLSVNENNGWIMKKDKVLKTGDRGKTWKDVTPYTNGSRPAYFFYDSKAAWISLSSRTQDKKITVYYTVDGGINWNKSFLPIKEDWENWGDQYICFTDLHNGFLLADSDPACGLMMKAIYKTSDGGKSWTRIGEISDKIDSYPSGIVFVNPNRGWITSYNHGQDYILTFRTDDGGHSWNKENLQIISENKDCYTNSYPPVFFGKDKMTGILPVEYINDKRKFIVPYMTRDGGNSWSPLKNLANHDFSCFDFIDEKQWLAIGFKDNKLYATNNGGTDWAEISQNEMLKDIKTLNFFTSQFGLASGDNIYMCTEDGGKTWTDFN